jgi:putative Holliday junction resolvase
MLTRTLKEFKQSLAADCRLMGLDIGSKTIGVALSDRDHHYCSPKLVLRRTQFFVDLQTINNYVNTNRVGGLVCGLPLNAQGNPTRFSFFVENFVRKLDEKLELPILMFNEFLTSYMAESFLQEVLLLRGKKIKKVIDKFAAAQILDEVLRAMAII